MAIFSIEEIKNLYEPFPLDAHKIREGSRSKSGKIQWFVYLDRPAIQKRLDVLFPGEWSSILGDFHRAPDYVTVTTTIAIRGIARAFNGGASPKWAEDDIDEDKEKGAATDSFRRAASLWGLGLYCYEGFRIWTDGYEKNDYKMRDAVTKDAWTQFERMYNDMFKSSPQPDPTPSAAKPAVVERTDIAPRGDEPMARVAGAETLTPEQVKDAKRKLGNGGKRSIGEPGIGPAFAQWTKKHKVDQADALAAMNVKYLSEWAGSRDEMLDLLRNHFNTRDEDGAE